MHPNQFRDAAAAKTFFLAGRATVTLKSQKTGKRFTYKITVPKETNGTGLKPHFVALLSGPDNENDYNYLGMIRAGHKTYEHGRKSRVDAGSPSVVAIRYAIEYIMAGRLPPGCEVWHEGKCCRCGRKLTVPESIENGIGPECIKHM